MYGEFTWWTGVVEDRIDPLKLGRCRVRILGYHSDKKGIDHIPTNTLPWATPSQPITSAAMNGIGSTPMGPVEGTWVFGFFRDGKNAQDPVMIGTFGGIPEARPDPTLGFNDPKGIYPQELYLNEPDTNRLGRGSGKLPVGTKSGENAPSLEHKRTSRQTDVPVALAGDMSTASGGDTIANTANTGLYAAADWFEPNPRYGGATTDDVKYLDSVKLSSLYPFNHVRQSESGHVEEWDDTPSAERLHRFHKKGTFEEIQPDGTKVTKVVGDEYEITLGLKDVLIQGKCNVTIKGDCRMLYQGDLVQEVYGDYHLNVHKDMRTKILGNEITEVRTDRKTVINGEDDLFVGKNRIINIAANLNHNVGGTMDETVTKDVSCTYNGSYSTAVKDELVFYCQSTIDIACVDKMNIGTNDTFDLYSTGAMKIETANTYTNIVASTAVHTVGSTYTITAGGTYKVTAPMILLN
jgi:hypothetical protein